MKLQGGGYEFFVSNSDRLNDLREQIMSWVVEYAKPLTLSQMNHQAWLSLPSSLIKWRRAVIGRYVEKTLGVNSSVRIEVQGKGVQPHYVGALIHPSRPYSWAPGRES